VREEAPTGAAGSCPAAVRNSCLCHQDLQTEQKSAAKWWFSLAGHQVPAKAALSLPLLHWTGEKKYDERFVGQDKHRKITQQSPSQAK